MEPEVPDSDHRSGQVSAVLLVNSTRWACTTRVALALAQAGCDVYAVCPARHPLLKIRGIRKPFPYRGLWPLQSLTAAIEAAKPQLVIPFDDRATAHLHELYRRARDSGPSGDEVAALIERSLGSPSSHAIVSSRCAFLDAAREEGLRVPDTFPIGTARDFESWQAGHPLPWVLKADGTFGGSGVQVANTAEEAQRRFLDMTRMFRAGRALKRLFVNRDSFWLRPWWRRSRPGIVVQSFVRGRPANCAVVCWKGRVLAGIGVDVVSAEGPTGPASVVRVVDNPEMMHCAERVARRFGLSGFFGLDFMIEDATGAAYLIEMNPRCTPLCHLQLGKGRDMIGALQAQISGQPARDLPPVTRKEMIAYFPDAWNSRSEFLQNSFQDIPSGEPDLVRELLRPWPERSLLFRLYALKDGTAGRRRVVWNANPAGRPSGADSAATKPPDTISGGGQSL